MSSQGGTVSLISAENLKKYFPIRGIFRISGYLRAVDGVSIEVKREETVGIVGESGSGKTTLGRLLLRLIEPTSGKIFFEGKDITSLSGKALRALRKEMQIVFQDPYTSLHPRMRVKDIVGEPLKIHFGAKEEEIREKVADLLKKVGMREEDLFKYPHEFSGGQRQRIVIARALITKPKFVILDEPTSNLDVSVQSKILNLLDSLKKEEKLTYLLITHNIAVVGRMSHRVYVMYLGKIVEHATTEKLLEEPLHPYTRALLSATPIPDPKMARARRRVPIRGEIPSPINPPKGCRFSTRCPYAEDKCFSEEPPLVDVGGGHLVACHLWEKLGKEAE
jgi:peptide/nickel transport system ATP-binding protein